VAYSINGFGTTYYGMRDFERDGSYITTKWVIAGTLPIFPVGSLRIREGRRGLTRQQMTLVEELNVDWWQVLMTYVYVYLCVPVAIYLIAMHQFSFIDDFRVPFWVVMVVKTLPFLFVLALPHLLRWWMRRSVKKR